MGNELYIGASNGIVLCVDGLNQQGCFGCFYHAYTRDAVKFPSLGEMLFRMEAFFDGLNYPRRSNSARSFAETGLTGHGGDRGAHAQERREKIMSDRELLGRHGQQETFIIRVQHRQNNTWQGRITWADKNKTLTFRSIWEMVHLMESALYEDADPDEVPEIQSWEEEDVD